MPAKSNVTVQPDYFVVMIDIAKIGREAVVDPQNNWNDVLEKVAQAASDGDRVLFVHQVHDGSVEDRSEEAFRAVMTQFANQGEPLSINQYEFVELHVSMQAAQSFQREAA